MFGEKKSNGCGNWSYDPFSNQRDDVPSPNRIEFRSPVIPYIRTHAAILRSNVAGDTLDKSHWTCDYSDDIFQSLRESELRRHTIYFRSPQIEYRPMLLQLTMDAVEKNKLSRTTLHLAIYFLDCFMDSYTIRPDKLNLTAITCLMIAAKIEEADMDMPKFADLNRLMGKNYNLQEYRNVERKVLSTFNFNVIRPTSAAFAEYFANNLVTLQDFHTFVNNWNNEISTNRYQHFHQQLQSSEHVMPHAMICSPCPYRTYEEMLIVLSKHFFVLIDVTLNYYKFVNARPSIIASACIAAVRQINGVFPIWTPYLINLTECTDDIISPFVEAILAIYRLQQCNEKLQVVQTPNTPIANNCSGAANIICDSPDSGIVSCNDTKSMKSDSDDDIDNCEAQDNADTDDDEDEPYHCLEYPLLSKRRKIL
ncbi:cyclin-J [Musca vetustissima]|uniref:cyclin-J n=1 Tax=Musca vetustissima TaxID=27455 RepID=UPI002AB72E1B|nr:cyclin-J [Musca vetustissima]